MADFAHIVTIVLHRDGRLRFTSEKISLDDAGRWVKEGFHVFRLAAGPDEQRWVVNHVATGELVTRPLPVKERVINSPVQLTDLTMITQNDKTKGNET